MNKDIIEIYDNEINKLQKVWYENQGMLSERHNIGAGIRSSQIAALLLYLIEIGVIKDG